MSFFCVCAWCFGVFKSFCWIFFLCVVLLLQMPGVSQNDKSEGLFCAQCWNIRMLVFTNFKILFHIYCPFFGLNFIAYGPLFINLLTFNFIIYCLGTSWTTQMSTYNMSSQFFLYSTNSQQKLSHFTCRESPYSLIHRPKIPPWVSTWHH